MKPRRTLNSPSLPRAKKHNFSFLIGVIVLGTSLILIHRANQIRDEIASLETRMNALCDQAERSIDKAPSSSESLALFNQFNRSHAENLLWTADHLSGIQQQERAKALHSNAEVTFLWLIFAASLLFSLGSAVATTKWNPNHPAK